MIKGAVFTIFLLLGIVGCTGQKPATLNSSENKINSLYAKKCENLDFHQTPFSKTNFENLFECTGWEKIFPLIAQELKSSSKNDFDYLMQYPHLEFYQNKETKNKFRQFLKTLESDDSFKEWSLLLQMILKDPHRVEFIKKSLKTPETQQSLKAFIKLIKDNGNIFKKQFQTTVDVLKIVGNKKEKFKNSFEYIFENSHVDLIKIIDEITKSISNLEKGDETRLVGEWIYHKDTSILSNWVNYNQSDASDFSQFINLATTEYPEIENDLKLILKAKENDFLCNSLSTNVPFVVKAKEEMESVLAVLAKKDQVLWIKEVLNGQTKNTGLKHFCTSSNSNGTVKDFISANERLLSRLEIIGTNPSHFYIMSTSQELIKSYQYNPWGLLEVLSGPVIKNLRTFYTNIPTSIQTDLNEWSYEFLKSLPITSFKTISETLEGWNNKENDLNFKEFIKFWNHLSLDDKSVLTKLILEIMQSDIDLIKISNSFELLIENFSDWDQKMLKTIFIDEEKTMSSLASIVESMFKKDSLDEWTQFVEKDHLFELFILLSLEAKKLSNVQKEYLVTSPSSFVLDPQTTEFVDCFKKFSSRSTKENYYSLINNLPTECKPHLKDIGFVGRIYDWMNVSNYTFYEYAGYELHSETGVWAPEFIHFLFGYAVLVGDIFKRETGSTQYDQLYLDISKTFEINKNRELINDMFLVFHKQWNRNLPAEKLLIKLSQSKSSEIKNEIITIIDWLQSPMVFQEIHSNWKRCQYYIYLPNDKRCLAEETIVKNLNHVIDELVDEENGKSVLEGIIELIHPDHGVRINSQKIVKTDIKTVLRFFYDLGLEETNRDYVYYLNNKTQKLKSSTISRLETLIDEISFTENFYGAFFMNEVADSNNYLKTLKKNKPLLKLLKSGSGAFRTFGQLPKGSKEQLKNVDQTFDSLAELESRHSPFGLEEKRYGELIQGLLKTIQMASPDYARSYSPWRIPNPRLSSKHKGIILTNLTKLSAFSRIHEYIKLHVDQAGIEKFFSSNEILLLNDLIRKIDHKTWNIHLRELLKNSKPWIGFFVKNKLSENEKSKIEKILLNLIPVITDKNLKKETIIWFLNTLNSILKFNDVIMGEYLNLKNKAEILDQLVSLSTVLKQNETYQDTLIGMLNMMAELFPHLSINEEDLNKIFSFISKFEKTPSNTMNYFVKAIKDERIHFEPFIQYANRMTQEKRSFELTDLINFLAESKNKKTNFEVMIEEIFINNQIQISEFLNLTYPALQLTNKSSSTLGNLD